ncbi:hypothetical protein CJ030_MR1G021680 [Morella rubra]|uniref:TOD1/MUCI70 glycosyltransferase-like domain-containing protein n=1 Tax=Morella rubra TaxID=262757 RepID=A0A6A1WSM8_9ROSI|nr:hypothetical protein CJ030_MR1G021680 [Morella rubra]
MSFGITYLKHLNYLENIKTGNKERRVYHFEGMEPWSPGGKFFSNVPEGAIIILEHTAMTNLFSCLWFNEVNLFTPKDQLRFGYVIYRLQGLFKFSMFPNCEYSSLFVLHPKQGSILQLVEWVKNLTELDGKGSRMKESRGGLGLWTPYPWNLDSVDLPPIARTSKAG